MTWGPAWVCTKRPRQERRRATIRPRSCSTTFHSRILTSGSCAESGGTSWVEDKYLHGIPELLTEVSRSSVSYDLHVKLDLYQAAGDTGVPGYSAVRTRNPLAHPRRRPLSADACRRRRLWRSRVFPGLWLDGNSILSQATSTKVLARLQEGLESPGAPAFVDELAGRKQARK